MFSFYYLFYIDNSGFTCACFNISDSGKRYWPSTTLCRLLLKPRGCPDRTIVTTDIVQNRGYLSRKTRHRVQYAIVIIQLWFIRFLFLFFLFRYRFKNVSSSRYVRNRFGRDDRVAWSMGHVAVRFECENPEFFETPAVSGPVHNDNANTWSYTVVVITIIIIYSFVGCSYNFLGPRPSSVGFGNEEEFTALIVYQTKQKNIGQKTIVYFRTMM